MALVDGTPERYQFVVGTSTIDRARVHRWLSEQSYWAAGRTRTAQDAAIDASRNYGVFTLAGREQVAYARAVTDLVTFAWLSDVFVAPQVRGSGVGRTLLAGIIGDLDAIGVARVFLSTTDGHGFYERLGFQALGEAGKFLVRSVRSGDSIDGS